MTPPDARLFAAMEATWPPVRRRRLGPFTLREGQGGGQRVSCTTVEGPFTEPDLQLAVDAMEDVARRTGQGPVFQIGPGAEALDAALAARGWAVHDPVSLYLAPVGALTAELPRLAAFALWPPLAIQTQLWDEGGIGPARRAVMERVTGPKAALLARTDDHAAGTAFVAVAEGIAMLHALHVADRWRRRGAARALMHEAANWAERNGADWLGLAVTSANLPANALYGSLGMAPAARYHYRIPGARPGEEDHSAAQGGTP